MPKTPDINLSYRRYDNSMEQVIALLKARVPLIYLVTHEENRFIDEFTGKVAQDLHREVWVWSQYQGLIKDWTKNLVPRAEGKEDGTWNPGRALQRIHDHEVSDSMRGNVYIMRDMHRVLGETTPRHLRDMYEHLIAHKKTLIIVAPYLGYGPGGRERGIEPSLEKQIAVVNYDLPTHDEIKSTIKDNVEKVKFSFEQEGKTPQAKLDYTDEDFTEFTRCLQGLTLAEAETAIATSLTHLKHVNIEKLLQEKKNIILKTDVLEYIDSKTTMSDVGGMDEAKAFFDSYSDAFTEEAKEYGVEPLRGVLFTGVPGTGKSLLAKTISTSWKLPLLRLDVGKVMTGLVGGSEQRMREAVKLAEACAPCILWIDEIEKALSGTKSSNFSDGGTLSRVFGTLLTAMQEGMENVTVIATANDISALPPELIRRFNEVFFVDLPSDDERQEIFNIHLKKRGRDPKKFKFPKLLKATRNYTGAEIEKSIKDAIAHAWTDGKRPMNSEDLLRAVNSTKPISQVMEEKIDAIRKWARDRARYASSHAAQANAPGAQKVVTSGGKEIEVDEALGDFSEIQTTKDKKKVAKGKVREVDLD